MSVVAGGARDRRIAVWLAVAVSFRTDGSLITVGTNGTEYVWDVAARQQTSAIPAPRGHIFQRPRRRRGAVAGD